MSDEITNPLYRKFDEVVDTLVKAKPAPEEADAESAEDQVVRERGEEGYGEEKRRKRSAKP